MDIRILSKLYEDGDVTFSPQVKRSLLSKWEDLLDFELRSLDRATLVLYNFLEDLEVLSGVPKVVATEDIRFKVGD